MCLSIFILILINTPANIIASNLNSYTPKYSNPFTESWRWQGYSELIGKGCRTMVEEKNGTLWFGVNGGVISYNGKNWKYFSLTKDSSNTPVVTLTFTSNGILYAGTSEGVFKMQKNNWEKLPINLALGDSIEHPYNKIPIIESTDGSLWIGTHKGAVRIKDNTYILYNDNNIIKDYNSDKKIDLKNLSNADVYNIVQDKFGYIWFGLRNGAIYKCQLSENSLKLDWHRVDSEPGFIRNKYPLIKVASNGNVFVVSGQNDGGINIFDGKKWSIYKSKTMFGIDDLYSDVIELQDGSICVSGVGRLFVYRYNGWKVYESITLPFSSNRLVLYQTKNQNLYIIGLGNEVWKIELSNERWATLKGVSFQAETKNGDKWFLSVEGNVIKSNSQMSQWTKYSIADGIIDDPVALIISKNGNVWIAGSDGQIAATACFDGKKWRKQIHPKIGWGFDRRAVYEASDGSLYFGSASDIFVERGQIGGIVRYSNLKDLDSIQYDYHFANDIFRLTGIYGIGETADKTIWAGQLGFYNLNYNSKKWKRILNPTELNASFIDYIATSPTRDLWIGTRTNGVFFLNSRTYKWEHFTVKDGLSSNTIVYIDVESNKNVWVATNRDISHFDGKSWTKNSFHSFLKPKMDGISIKSSKDGGLWVNQNPPAWYRKSLYKKNFYNSSEDDFFTTRYYTDKNPPETRITFSQEKIAQPGNVILSWAANDPWKLTPDEQLQYSYRIDENEWSSYQYKTSDIFLSLSSGDHIFEVRARDSDLNVDPTPAKISFYVIPPVWAEPWFILLILSFLSIIAFFIIHLYKRNKIIEEISETKVKLFANISHELRTPITLIIGPLLKVLESPLLDPKLKDSITLVNKNSHRLLRLINQVLDFRKMEAGQLKFEPKIGDIISFLKDEVTVFHEKALSKNIDLNFESNTNVLKTCFDPDKIEKIMFNLLANALKFTPQGGYVSVRVEIIDASKIKSIDLGLKKQIKFSQWIEIIIKDSGVGISKRNLDKVFNRFYQVQDHMKTAVGGTGIGLSIVKEMVKIHGGKIELESTEGIGTIFQIKIPLIDEDEIEEVAEVTSGIESGYISMKYPENENEDALDDSSSEENPKEKKRKILIVEDNLEMRKYIKEELQSEYEICEAINGEEGVAKAATFYPDLIISDIIMPQMDGIEFCKKIKNDEQTSHIAVVLLTARSSQENKMEGLETGADDYLIKPFYAQELKLRLRNILTTRQKLREKFGKNLNIEPNSIEITSVDQKFLSRAISIIEENMEDENFSVEKFSKLVGMSRVSLYNKLKSLTNHPVQEFIFAIRLKRAAQLLKESGMTVTEIAYSVGFKDPSHFSKLFKKQFGVSPKAYCNEKPNNIEKTT